MGEQGNNIQIQKNSKKRSNFKIMLKLSGLVKPLSGYMVLAILMGLVGNLCATFIAVLGGYAILDVLGAGAASGALGAEAVGMADGAALGTYAHIGIVAAFVLAVILAVIRGVLRYGEQACNHFIAFKLLALIRDKVFGALRKLCPAKLDGRDKGDLISVITSDIELLEVFYAHTISPCAIALLFSVVMCVYLAGFHMIYGLIALAAYLVVGVVIPVIVSKVSSMDGVAFRSGAGALSGFVLDSLRGLREIIQYGIGSKRLEQMNSRTEELSKVEKTMKDKLGTNMAVTNVVIWIFDFLLLMVAAYLYSRNEVGFGGVLLPMLAFMGSFGPVVALANLGSTLGNTFAAGNRVLDILEESPVVEEVMGRPEVEFNGIKAENVEFSYGSAERGSAGISNSGVNSNKELSNSNAKILDNFSVEIPKSKVVGITGKSGSGKSTFLKLLMRFWETDGGTIKISERNINEINTVNLRNMESFVTQETHLFSDSIFNNLRVAKENATLEEVQAACKKASIHDVIMSFPQGYDTPVGELGDTLSGGEKQRIGLARAFLHDSDLMLLDEPTSNLDSLNEGVILKALREECAGKTVILVSHRKSTMGIADVAYSVENGRMS